MLSLQLGVSNLFLIRAGIAVISAPRTGPRLIMPFGATTRPTWVQSTGLPRNCGLGEVFKGMGPRLLGRPEFSEGTQT